MQVYFNYITASLNITKKTANLGYHSGDCLEDIDRIMELPEIKRQLKKIDPEQLKKELYDYGAWDDSELENHKGNLQRILWIACGDIVDNKY